MTEAPIGGAKDGNANRAGEARAECNFAGASSAALADEAVMSFHRAMDAVMRAFVGLDPPARVSTGACQRNADGSYTLSGGGRMMP